MSIASTRDARARMGATRTDRPDWRAIAFRIVVAPLVIFIAAGIGPLLLAPWALVGPAAPGYTPELHRWHHADIAALTGLLIGGSLLALIPRPRSAPVVAQFALLAIGLLILVCLRPFHPSILAPAALIGGLVLAGYPAPRALWPRRGAGATSRPLLGLTLAAAVPLLLNAWTSFRLQFGDASEHARDSHWAGSAALALSLLLAGFLAASGRPGWRALAVVAGLTYGYLGVAALTIPRHDGSWGVLGGLLALGASAGFIVATILEGRRRGARGE